MTPNECAAKRFLLLAYGNPSRGDDGLGYALANALADCYANLDVAWRYQPAIEDAAEVAAHAAVIFADAARDGEEQFLFSALAPAADSVSAFSSHTLSPAAVLYLAKVCFRTRAEAYLLAIRGYDFADFSENLSAGAAENLRSAIAFLRGWLEKADTATTLLPTLAAPRGKDAI